MMIFLGLPLLLASCSDSDGDYWDDNGGSLEVGNEAEDAHLDAASAVGAGTLPSLPRLCVHDACPPLGLELDLHCRSAWSS